MFFFQQNVQTFLQRMAAFIELLRLDHNLETLSVHLRLWSKKVLQMVRFSQIFRERSRSVVECRTPDQGVAGWSLAGVAMLCPWARHINPCLVLVQPRKTRPNITEDWWLGCQASNQPNTDLSLSPTYCLALTEWNKCYGPYSIS